MTLDVAILNDTSFMDTGNKLIDVMTVSSRTLHIPRLKTHVKLSDARQKRFTEAVDVPCRTHRCWTESLQPGRLTAVKFDTWIQDQCPAIAPAFDYVLQSVLTGFVRF